MYLATILDAFTLEVVAWNISSRNSKELITETRHLCYKNISVVRHILVRREFFNARK